MSEEILTKDVLECVDLLIELTTAKISVTEGTISPDDDTLIDTGEAAFDNLDGHYQGSIAAAAVLLLEAAFNPGDCPTCLPSGEIWQLFVQTLKAEGVLRIHETD